MYNNLRYFLPLHIVLGITNWLPDNVIFLRFRGYLASFFFKKCGKNLRLGRNVTFYNSSKIKIGNSVYIAYGSWILGNENLEIEDDVMLGPYVVISPANHSKLDGSFSKGIPESGKLVIGKGSWIGAHSTLVLGASVGKGALVAANSVLNKNTEENSLYAGVPAKFIKYI